MHLLGVIVTVAAGIYTVSWAWKLLRGGNKAGALWSFLLALVSTAVGLYYYYQSGFFP